MKPGLVSGFSLPAVWLAELTGGAESQRAKVAAKLANMPLGGASYRSANSQSDSVSQSRAAELLNVGTRTVAAAAKVERDSPEVFEQIGTGKYANLQTYAHTRTRVADTTPPRWCHPMSACRRRSAPSMGA